MKSKQLQTLVAVLAILIFVWLVEFGVFAWNGAFGDPNKPANPLFLLLWWGPAGLFGFGAAVLDKRAKMKAKAEKRHTKAAAPEPPTPLDASGEEPESLEKAYKSLLGARFRYDVLPIGVLTILGFGFSIILAIMTKSGFNETGSSWYSRIHAGDQRFLTTRVREIAVETRDAHDALRF